VRAAREPWSADVVVDGRALEAAHVEAALDDVSDTDLHTLGDFVLGGGFLSDEFVHALGHWETLDFDCCTGLLG
jgi:hypothetical protein